MGQGSKLVNLSGHETFNDTMPRGWNADIP